MSSILSKRSAVILLLLLLSFLYMATTSKAASAARQTKAWVFTNNLGTAFNPPAEWWDSGINNWDWAGSKVTNGDYNGDGFDDLAVLYGYKTTRQCRLFVFISDGAGSYAAPVIWWDSGPGNWDWEGSKLTSGDFSGDGVFDDVAVLYGYGSTRQTKAFVFTSTGATFNPPTEWWDSGPGNWDWEGSKLTAGQYDAGATWDLAVLYGYGSTRQCKAWVLTSTGATFNPPAEWWDSGPGNWDWEGSKLTTGWFDGAAFADLAVLYGYKSTRQTKAWVLTSNALGNAFNPPAEWWDSGPGNWDWEGSKLTMGWYDGVAGSDLAVLYGYRSTRQTKAWVFTSNGVTAFNPPAEWWDSGPGNWDWEGSKLTSGWFTPAGSGLAVLYGYN